MALRIGPVEDFVPADELRLEGVGEPLGDDPRGRPRLPRGKARDLRRRHRSLAQSSFGPFPDFRLMYQWLSVLHQPLTARARFE